MQPRTEHLRNDLIQPLAEHLAEHLGRYGGCDGIHPTAIPRLAILKASSPTQPLHTLQHAAVCLIVQGSKRVMLGKQVFQYSRGYYLAASVDVPIVGSVLEASPARPYLCLRLDLDAAVLSDLLLSAGDKALNRASPGTSLRVCQAQPRLLEIVARMVDLLDHPEDIPVLAPLVERELLYWLLKGELGDSLRQIASGNSRLSQVNRAIQWLKRNFHEPFSMDRLASEARMSPSSLYQHFKAVTHMSPLQYQKRLRLQEARRLMLADGADIGNIGYRVGYESASQFSREYSRLFGAPPSRDLARLRESGTEEALL